MMLFGVVGCATGNDWLDVCGGPDYISVDQGVFKRNFVTIAEEGIVRI